MTGFGRVSGTFENKKINVEIRSLNSKSLDLYVRSVPLYRELELQFRNVISKALDRGKVELTIAFENGSDVKSASINKELAVAYYNELVDLAQRIQQPTTDLMAQVLRMPEVISNEKEQLSEEETAFVVGLVEKACVELNAFRDKEGEQLTDDFSNSIQAIRDRLTRVPDFEHLRIDIVRERMRSGLEKLETKSVDDNRFEQELIYYIEKMDISEEKMRLSNHLDYFMDTMKEPLSGKKLGFITQEIGREINTLGSKSYHVELQKLVVEMKDYLEKIKEQVLNTL